MTRRYKQRHEGHSILQAAKICGITMNQLRYAIRMGDCPPPELGDRRKYYSTTAIIKLKDYWQRQA